MNFGELEDIICVPELELKEFDHCLRHSRPCRRVFSPNGPSQGQVLTIVAAGSPCPDYSNFGKHCGQSGEAAPAFITLSLVAFSRHTNTVHSLFVYCSRASFRA